MFDVTPLSVDINVKERVQVAVEMILTGEKPKALGGDLSEFDDVHHKSHKANVT